jgi:hypothetical protein
VLELLFQCGREPGAKLSDPLVELGLGTEATRREHAETHRDHETGRQDTGDVDQSGRGQSGDNSPQPDGSHFYDRQTGHRVLHRVGQPVRFHIGLVGVYRAVGGTAQRIKKLSSVLVEAAEAAHHPVGMMGPPLGQTPVEGLPLAEFGAHHPIDDLPHLLFYLVGGVRDHFALELLFHAGLSYEIEDAAYAHGLVQELLATLLQFSQHSVHIGDAEIELAAEILLVEVKLMFDAVQRGHVIRDSLGWPVGTSRRG